MASDQRNDLTQQKAEADLRANPKRSRALFSWWYVWIPVIVAVILWIGGWWFGNYGGPWTPKWQSAPPKISDAASIHKT